MVRKHIFFSGWVQGVGFRYRALYAARAMGLTGWVQIHGRDELEIAEKAKLDGWYVEHMSFWLDVKCFFGTIKAVADHDGVVEGGTGTLHEEGK